MRELGDGTVHIYARRRVGGSASIFICRCGVCVAGCEGMLAYPGPWRNINPFARAINAHFHAGCRTSVEVAQSSPPVNPCRRYVMSPGSFPEIH
jgi:hypothetical protein